MRFLVALGGLLAVVGNVSPVMANGVGENYAWQFETSADKANQAAVLDMLEKKKAGYYAPPTYVTNIERQYNCNVSSTATGNQGTNTNLASSPTTSGNTASSTGNSSQTDVGGLGGSSSATNGQSNSGSVGSSVNGSTSAHVSGSPSQALNSTQTNSGNQSASVDGSTACHFANVLN